MTRTRRWWALVVSAALLACGSSESKPARSEAQERAAGPARGPLAAGEKESIRGVGRAVLLAQRDAVEDPDIVALAREIDGLREDLGRLLQTPIAIDGEGPVADPRSTMTGPVDAANVVRARTESIRTQRLLLAAKGARNPNSATGARAASLASAAERIEAEARDALNVVGHERLALLADLHRRLRRQGLSERRAALNNAWRPAALVSPGNATLTKHR